MNYENTIIDNQAILEFRDGVEREVRSCTDALKRMAQKIQKMQTLDGLEGEAAESIKTYFSEVHLFLLEAIGEALTECEAMLNQYAMEILCQVDSSPYARVPVSDLLGMQDQVKNRYLDMDETMDSVNKLMSSIQDLVQVNPIQTEVGSTGGPFAMPRERTLSVSYDRENIVKSAIVNGNSIGLLEHCEEVRSILKESVDKIDRINFDYAMDKIPILEDYVKILDGSIAEYSDIARNMENYHSGDYNKWDSTKCLSDQMLLYSLYYTTNQEEILLAKETLQQVSMEMQQVENKAKKDNTISVAKEIGSVGISLIPLLGDGKDLQESISGLDLITGKKLSALERVLAGACVIVPVVSGSMVRIAGKNADIAEKMSLLSEKQLFKKAGKGITMCEDAKIEMEQLIQGIRTMLEEDADIKRLFIRKTGAGPQVEIAGVGKVSLEEAEKLVGKDVRWSRGESGSTTTYKILNTSSAEDVNKIFKDTMGYEPPYKPGTSVTEIQLTENATYVRVYDKVNSRMQGGWVMKAEDIAELTPQEIQNKFALPNTPKYICDVNLEAGTRLRTGEVNPLFGFDGGGQQYDLIINRKNVGTFTNERTIGQ